MTIILFVAILQLDMNEILYLFFKDEVICLLQVINFQFWGEKFENSV